MVIFQYIGLSLMDFSFLMIDRFLLDHIYQISSNSGLGTDNWKINKNGKFDKYFWHCRHSAFFSSKFAPSIIHILLFYPKTKPLILNQYSYYFFQRPFTLNVAHFSYSPELTSSNTSYEFWMHTHLDIFRWEIMFKN